MKIGSLPTPLTTSVSISVIDHIFAPNGKQKHLVKQLAESIHFTATVHSREDMT